MKTIRVNDRLSIGPQPNLSDFSELRSLGNVSVINNRADGEESNQPTAEEASLKAKAVGLSYVHQPVNLGTITVGDVRYRGRRPAISEDRHGTRGTGVCSLQERYTVPDALGLGRGFGWPIAAVRDHSVRKTIWN